MCSSPDDLKIAGSSPHKIFSHFQDNSSSAFFLCNVSESSVNPCYYIIVWTVGIPLRGVTRRIEKVTIDHGFRSTSSQPPHHSRCFLSLSNHIHSIRRPPLVFSPHLPRIPI